MATTLEQGARYQGGLRLGALAPFASESVVRSQLEAAGFSGVEVFSAAPAWAAGREADWYVRGTWARPTGAQELPPAVAWVERVPSPAPAPAAVRGGGMQVFPVELSARPRFEDTWGAPRSGGRTHQGQDIFAARGTPVLAVADGHVMHGVGEPLGGNVAYLVEPDRTRYVYSHLDAFEGQPRRVRAGEVIGYVGNTGNAASAPPHVHFEVHPQGGAAVNPYAELVRLSQGAATSPGLPRPASDPRTAQPALAAGWGSGAAFLLFLWAVRRSL